MIVLQSALVSPMLLTVTSIPVKALDLLLDCLLISGLLIMRNGVI